MITFIPLVWLVAVTFTAGAEKIFHSDPRIGFLAQARSLAGQTPALQSTLAAVTASSDARAIEAGKRAVDENRTLQFNSVLDAVVAGMFLALVTAILLLSLREWIWLLTRRKAAVLHETEPVWLPDYAVREGRPVNATGVAGAAAIALALAKELSGEADLARAHQQEQTCRCPAATAREIYVAVTEQRFNGVRRCC